MNAMELLSSRRSVGKLVEPAPDQATLDRVLDAALRAPDHGALRPWRVVLIRGDARRALGDLFAETLARHKPDATPEELDDARRKAARSPLVIAVACVVGSTAKIPEVEQLLSAGAVMHGLLLGFQAEGFGAVWKTGKNAYDPAVKARFGLRPTDHLVGFLYVGSVGVEPPAVPRPTRANHVVEWKG